MSSEFVTKMSPYANKVSQATGIPTAYVLAQWQLETGGGTSSAAKKLNNYAGIKANSRGADYDGGTYAGYNSINSFVNDYIRYFNQPVHPNYAKAKEEAKKGNATGFFNYLQGTWAEDTSYTSKAIGILGGGAIPVGKVDNNSSVSPGGVSSLIDFDGLKEKVENLNSDQLMKFALIGLGVVALTRVLD